MKILFVSAFFDDHGGGIEKVVKISSQALAARDGVNVTWVALEENRQELICGAVKRVGLSGTNICEAKFGFPYPIIWLKSIKKLYQLVGDSDLIHLHDYIYMSNLISWLIAKILKKPVFITQHIGAVNYKNALLRNLHHFMNVTVGAFVLKRVEKVIFISSSVFEYFESIVKKNMGQKWSYIPNGVDTTLFKPGDASSAKSGRDVIFVGRFVEKKGLEFLKKVAQLSPQVQYLFIGDGPLSPDSWGLSNVEVVGYVADEKELAEYYRNAALFVLPSHGEGFPLVVQEALACGVKIIISEDVRSGCDGLIDDVISMDIWNEDAPLKWAERIINEIGADPLSKREKLVRLERINAFVLKNWSWENVVQQHCDAYELYIRRQKLHNVK